LKEQYEIALLFLYIDIQWLEGYCYW